MNSASERPSATGMTDERIAELRDRARIEAGPFVDPCLLGMTVHNPEWATAILGRTYPGLMAVSWPEMYLLHIAKQAEPDPPPPPKATVARELGKRQQEEVERQGREIRAQARREWEELAAALPVKVEVRHNYTSARHLGHYVQGGDHIYLLEELRAGRLRRPAGRVLCWTPSRGKDLREFPEPAADGRVPNCKACLKTARRLAVAAAEHS